MCWLPPKLLRGRGLWGEGGGLPCSPAALPTSSISEFCGAPEVLCLLTAQLHFAQVSPTESQQQEIARQDEKCSKSPKEGGHCLELLQRSLKRSSRRGTPCRQAHRMLLGGSPRPCPWPQSVGMRFPETLGTRKVPAPPHTHFLLGMPRTATSWRRLQMKKNCWQLNCPVFAVLSPRKIGLWGYRRASRTDFLSLPPALSSPLPGIPSERAKGVCFGKGRC